MRWLWCLVLVMVACSDDPVVVQPTSAKTSVVELGRIVSSMAAQNGSDVGEAILGWGSSHPDIVRPEDQIGLRLFPRTFMPVPINTGSAVCDTASCMFTDYGIVNNVTFWVIGGSIGFDGTTTTFALSATFMSRNDRMNWAIDGSVVANATSVEGTIYMRGDGRIRNFTTDIDVNWEVPVAYHAVELDAQGCPIGGSLDVIAKYETSTEDKFVVEGQVTFGPSC